MQNSQGSVSGEALEGPARSGMRCANRGQHGILPVMALDTPWPGAVRLYCQNAAQAVFAQIELDMTGRPGLGWRGFDQAYAAIQQGPVRAGQQVVVTRSEEHTSELQSLMRISY